MKEKYLNSTISFITKYKEYSNEEIENMRYSLEGLYLTFTKLIVIFSLAIILGIFKEVIILLILFNIIRFTGFGFHAKKSMECLITSTLLFVGVPYLVLYLEPNKITLLVIGIISLIILSIYAPADTVKRPLPNKKKRLYRKIGTIVIASAFIIISLFIKNNTISYLLIIALFIESIMVSPLIYKIFGQPYKNYLNYKKA